MPLQDFPQLLGDFLNEYPDTPEIEGLGANLAQLNFPADGTEEFVRRVLEWAGKQGVRRLSTVLKENTPTEIADALRNSSSSLNQGQFVDALTPRSQTSPNGRVLCLKASTISPTRHLSCVRLDSASSTALQV
jgi:hypothetical protein